MSDSEVKIAEDPEVGDAPSKPVQEAGGSSLGGKRAEQENDDAAVLGRPFLFGACLLASAAAALSASSVASCKFAQVTYVGGARETTTITQVGLFRYWEPRIETCLSYHEDGQGFFLVDKVSQGFGIAAAALGGFALIIMLARAIDPCGGCGGAMRKWWCTSWFLLLISAICQALTFLFYRGTNETGEDGLLICNPYYSTCSLGAGAIMSIVALVLYFFLAMAISAKLILSR
uniref:Uncharacterized protein n=1 Tax=Pseudictyota dubia TaxID=2749911 RepID=A0A7R9ZJK4_9STRA|mmetsp:Transcript_9055/g.16892  ORF Transcript_9055/g.16892 Transcript_9055/m.16892 type:complete len:232 (+) Transcript_9055:111-806(+)